MTKATTRKPATKRAAAKTAKRPIQKRKTTPALTPVPDDAAVPAPLQIEEEAALDEATREQFRQFLDEDQIDNIIPLLGGIHEHGRNLGRYEARHDVADDLRYLAEARADYDRGTAPEPEDMDDAQKAACIRAEHVAAFWLAGIIELSKSPAGWMPSWRWSGWEARLAERGIEVKTN